MPLAILQKGEKQAKKHTLATSDPFDTLDSIAAKNKVATGWQGIANYLFGTTQADEVNRALRETIGVAKVDLVSAQKTQLKPMQGGKTEIPLPEDWTKSCDGMQRYRLTVKRQMAPTAISITNLDKWFIPGLETNDIRFTVEGDPDYADKVDFVVFGSNYCECTDWNKGFGKYNKLENEPIFREEGMRAPERGQNEVLNVTGAEGKNAWKGQANAAKGMFSFKTKNEKGEEEKERFINVAFSPYTVLFRYRKTTEDKKALLLLEPFWPQWEEQKKEPAVTANFGAAPASFQWQNDSDQDFGALEVTDATRQGVHLAVLDKDKLEKGSKTITWDKNYREDSMNGKFTRSYIDDAAATATDVLFKSTPYTAKIATFTHKLKADSAKVKWEIKDTTKLERGLLIITDKDEVVVFQKALGKDLVGQKKHEFAWDGKYSAGIRNSKAKKDDPKDKIYEAIPDDMPYRVQIQVHTGEGKTEGLALAAMHTEVRLYAHKQNYRPDDVRFDSAAVKPSLQLAIAPHAAAEPKKDSEQTQWVRYQLAEYGFHPGPVTDAAEANAEFHLALKEFKRSVPKHKSGADYERQTVNATDSDAETLAAIENMEPRLRRNWFGKLADILGDQADPDHKFPSGNSTDLRTISAKLADTEAKEELVVWVDDRQYYTKNWIAVKNGDNQDYEQAPFNLDNYRGNYNIGIGEHKAKKDAESIPRPWLPLQARPILLSQKEDLYGCPPKSDKPFDPQRLPEGRLKAMAKALGPLRLDWSAEDLPPDLSVMDPASFANYDTNYVRTRFMVGHAIYTLSNRTYVRKDTKRPGAFWNCPKDATDPAGQRPTALATYHQEIFGHGKLSLSPWQATPITATETIATVLHEHLVKDQKTKDKGPPQELFQEAVGSAGLFFHPSRIAGDGYRVRAQVHFEKTSDYEFLNLEVLKNRYPVPPQAASVRLRLWRRCSIRGYVKWTDTGPGNVALNGAATGNWPAFINSQMRRHYRMSHIYYVQEGGGALRDFPITDAFDPSVAAHRDLYEKLVKNNVDNAFRAATVKLKTDITWPWSDAANFGIPNISPPGLTWATVDSGWIRKNGDGLQSKTWHKFSTSLLFGLLQQLEKRHGLMRGHLFVEFQSSGKFYVQRYACAAGHDWFVIRKTDAAVPGFPNCSCGQPRVFQDYVDWDSLPWDALGLALGATWLFVEPQVAADQRGVWAHEVGHHRHFNHAASAPNTVWPDDGGAGRDGQHDSTANSKGAFPGATAALDRRWDRRCIMSYTNGEQLFFCGRCVLRHSGWKVESLALPPGGQTEPT